jgi:uncharacterized protein (DUF736 family)
MPGKENLMANIGEIHKTPAGNLVGRVGTLSFAVAFWLVDNPRDRVSEKSPTHIIMAKDPLGGECEIGVVRQRTAKQTGEVYLQIQFTDGSIPEKYHWLAVFGNEVDGYNIVFDAKPKPEAQTEEAAA